jgi:hypothetical protein
MSYTKKIILTAIAVSAVVLAGYHSTHKSGERDFNNDGRMDKYTVNTQTGAYTLLLKKRNGLYMTIDNVDSLKLGNIKNIKNLEITGKDSLESLLRY